MRKEAVLMFLVLIVSLVFVFAEDNVTTANYTQKIESGFSCLEEKAGDDCSNLESVSEISLTILASPTNIFNGCVEKLKQKVNDPKSLESKELAQATLALSHAGQNTTSLVNELLNRSLSNAPVDWIINGIASPEDKVSCTIKYDESERFEFDVDSKGKVSITKANRCFSLDYNDFRIKISNLCYGKELTITCGDNFKIPLFYTKQGGDIYYLLKDTPEGVPNQELDFSVNSLCVVDRQRRICNYEATLWGAYAILEATGNSIKDYMPYVVTSLDSYSTYFPEAFIPLLDPNLLVIYSEKILEKQKTDGSWHLSTYGDQYDTALALLSYGIKRDTTDKSERWLYTKQKDDGCWRDMSTTAMVLWAITQKSAPSSSGNDSSTLNCESQGENYYCLPSNLCDSSDIAHELYVCSGANVCCTTLKTCSEWGGISCEESKVCSGVELKSSDVEKCCLTSCVVAPSNELTTCEETDERNDCYSVKPQNSENYVYEEQSNYLSASCGEDKTCYKRVEKENGLGWIIWVLIILILGILGVLVWKFKDKIKAMLNKTKGKKGDKGNQPPNNLGGRPPFPPGRPGFPPQMNRPPINRGMPPSNPMIRPAPTRGMPPRFNMPPPNQQNPGQNGI